MKKHITHAEVKKELLADPQVFAAYKDLEEEFQLVREMLRARKRANVTQEAIASYMKTTASSISRLESIPTKKKYSPSFETLKKYAHALGCRITIKFLPQKTLHS